LFGWGQDEGVVKQLVEALTSHYPKSRGVDLSCQSVLRHAELRLPETNHLVAEGQPGRSGHGDLQMVVKNGHVLDELLDVTLDLGDDYFGAILEI
jgi:hypothetical protein